MRKPPHAENYAAVRVHERLEEKVRLNPDPPRSEIVDLMVAEAMEREQAIEEGKAAKSKAKPGGLKAAQSRPVSNPVPQSESMAEVTGLAKADGDEPQDETMAFFENLLASAPAGDNQEDNQ
ncbi:hypothetical protein ACEU07_20950 [Chromobacterium violaceum]|uniref:hypothetical protein n=1 Tax=Chromobacterium violaceum TaxID=536 RepID=UPI0035A6A425